MLKTVKVLVVLALLSALGGGFYIYNYGKNPPGKIKEGVVMEIEPGSSFTSISKKLEKKGILENERMFYLYAKIRGLQSKAKAGEYLIEPAMSTDEILDRLVRGSVITHRITIPEGYNIYQVADMLEEKKITKKKDFIKKAKDKNFMASLNVKGVSLEGYLYPETYFFFKGMKTEEIMRQMVNRFHTVFTDDLKKKSKAMGFTMEEVVTLASIIEKETGNPDERPLISAAFHNRLKKKMRLQSDPTTIYGIIETFDGNLRRKDLLQKTPYNTYKISGLPLGPIANPGIESIKAALNPADVDYIFFVSMNNGSHIFAKTYKEHNKNVWKYQKSGRNR
ncbi:MAG: endolytic transglycosylase MltG [Deltaproteobacteria bacterium]|nr:endolytic transglycosylase MltG [Deltaproteobacteria bacterium]